jgi:hypothetical protein
MARLVIVALTIMASIVGATPAAGFAQQTGIAADIRQGNCSEVGDIVVPLGEATIPEGEARGNAAAMPAANSFTTVPHSLEALTTSDHAIVVPFPVGEELVACGELGGTLTKAGALIVGIRPQGDIDISGIAFLSPSTDPAQTNISLFLSGESLESFLATTFLPPQVVTEEDATRFADALATRNDAASLAGPFAGTLVQQEGLRIVKSAGITEEDFAATITFTNPTEQTETPWDVGFAFHGTQDTAQIVAVDSDGVWFYQDSLNRTLQAAPLSALDPSPGATNTLGLVVEGTTALFGVNGELVANIELPPSTASDILVGTGFFIDHAVEGREIAFRDFEVWEGPAATTQTATPPAMAGLDDTARFAAALAARDGTQRLAGPFGGTLHQRQDDQLTATGAGLSTEAFSATVTFVNPLEQTATQWDFGFTFHLIPEPFAAQQIVIDSAGVWYYNDFPNGIQQSGIVPAFDSAPRGTNTLDLIVEDGRALFGVNGEFVANIELPAPIASDVLVATDFFPQDVVEGREIIYSTFQVWEAPGLSALPTAPTASPAEDDAARFAEALAARDDSSRLARRSATRIPERQGSFIAVPAGITTEDFSATATFINPSEDTQTPWDIGFAFRETPAGEFQAIYVDSEKFWYYQGTRSGWVPQFDARPGGTNTLDLVVEGTTALLGVNGEFVASIDLPPPTAADVLVGIGFFADHKVEGREIIFSTFEVWG